MRIEAKNQPYAASDGIGNWLRWIPGQPTETNLLVVNSKVTDCALCFIARLRPIRLIAWQLNIATVTLISDFDQANKRTADVDKETERSHLFNPTFKR